MFFQIVRDIFFSLIVHYFLFPTVPMQYLLRPLVENPGHKNIKLFIVLHDIIVMWLEKMLMALQSCFNTQIQSQTCWCDFVLKHSRRQAWYRALFSYCCLLCYCSVY